jgi:hypothetical protein
MRSAPVLLLAILAAGIGPLTLAGLPESFASSGQDADTALLFLHGFAVELERGAWWPRWLTEGNRDFGSPAFLFYPPVAYWAAAGLQRLLQLEVAEALPFAAVLWRLGAAVLAYTWFRTRMRPWAALFGTTLFSVHAYNMLVNPLVGFAYTEIAGTCVVLLGLLAAGSRRPLLWVALAFALLVLTHLPTAVLAGGVLPARALATGAGREALWRLGHALAGCALGSGLAAPYLMPALLLLPEINSVGWDTDGLTIWSGHFLLDSWSPSKPVVHFWFMNAGLVLMLASLPALGWIGRRGLPVRQDRFLLATGLLLLLVCAMTTRLSWPIWAMLPPLQRVQFPWRLMVFATAIWAMLVGRRLDQLALASIGGGGRLAAGLVLLFGAMALWIPYSTVTAARPEFTRYDWTRLHPAPPGQRSLPSRNPPEYAPRAAVLAGWRAEDPATDAAPAEALARSRAAAPGVEVAHDGSSGLRLRGRAEAASSLLLPQFAFPGWTLTGQPARASLSTDPATGLLRVELPAGGVDLRVTRGATGPERVGWGIGAAALLAWLALAVALRIRSARPAVSSPSGRA